MHILLRDPRAIALLLAASLTILSNMLISPALPGIEARFTDSPNAGLLTRLLVTAPALLVAILAPFAGMISDRFGRRRQLLAGVALFGIAGTAGLWLPTLPSLLGSRLLLGLAVSLIMTAQTALIGDYFTGHARAKFMGLQMSVINFSGLIFVLIAGGLAGLSPFLPFAIYGVALLYLPFLWRVIREVPQADKAHANANDLGTPGWQGMLALVAFMAGVIFISFYMIPTQAPYFLAEIGHPEPFAAAGLMATFTFAGGVSALAFGRVRPRFGQAGTPVLGFAFLATGFVLMGMANGYPLALLAGLSMGSAMGLIMPTFLSLSVDLAPARRRGFATGTVVTSIFLGQFLSPIATQPLVTNLGYQSTFFVGAVITVALGLVAFFTLQEKPALPAAPPLPTEAG